MCCLQKILPRVLRDNFVFQGASGLDEFCVECSGWKDEDDRDMKSAEDSGGQLIFDFLQYNEGAKLSEIIHKSSSEYYSVFNFNNENGHIHPWSCCIGYALLLQTV